MTTARGSSDSSQDVPECPYVGLEPFGEQDAGYFFGRERESDLIVANLTASRLTLLFGPSGVGKSSVLRAGVLPALRHIDDGTYDDLGVPGAAVAYVSAWRDSPLGSVAAEISAAVSHVTGAAALDDAMDAPTLSVSWLREVLSQSKVRTVYLIFDQFEEYFFYHSTDHGADGLTVELGRILSARDLSVHVLLSIRDDALAGLARFKGRVPHLFDNYLRLAHLSRESAHAAIKGPLDRYNHIVPLERKMSIGPGLIETLLDQVRTGYVQVTALDGVASAAADGRGDVETPFLQLVLIRLWEQERATGSSSLQLGTLDDLGGAQTIVQCHLDDVIAGLSPAQVTVAAAVFRQLVTTSGAKIALTAEDLADRSGLLVNEVQDLLETLSAGPQRILRPVLSAVGVTAPRRYEIFHDVLGPAVLDWRRRFSAEQQVQQQQAESSRQLIAEREKARAAALAARRRLRQRLLAVGLAVVLLVIGGVGYLSNRNAQQQTLLAKQQTLLAQAATALGDNPVQSLRHAVEAYNLNANESACSAVLAAASSPRSHVVAGPDPGPNPMMVIGMKVTPDSRHVVAYDARGSIRVIAGTGAVEREVKVSGLRGAVSSGAWAAAVSPDASRVALGTDQGLVAVINTATGRQIDIMSEGDLAPVVRWIGSAANGLVLVVSKLRATESRAVATYSPDTGKLVARFPGDVSDALPLADDQHIVTSGKDGKLRVWDAQNGTKVAESSALSPTELVLTRSAESAANLSVVALAGGAKPSIVVWDWHAGLNPVQYSVNGFNDVAQIVVNESAKTVIIWRGKEVRTYSLVDGSPRASFPQQMGLVTDVAISPDNQWITTASDDGRVLVWFPGHRQSPTASTYELLAHRGEVLQVSYLPDRKVVMSLGIDGTVRRWELPQVPRFEGHDDSVVYLDLSRDGHWLATASQDDQAFIFDPRDLLTLPVAKVSAGNPLRVVLFDPTEPHHILTLGRPYIAPTLWRWGGDRKPAELLKQYATPPLPTFGFLVSLAISPDGKTVASGDTSGTIYLWDAMSGALRTDHAFPGTGQPADSVAFDPTGQLLAATDSAGIRLWRLDTAQPLPVLPHPHATRVTFDLSGQRLASTDGDGTVKIWTRDGTLDHELVAHGHLSSSPSFSGDGRLLAVGTAAGQVEVWDVRSGVTVLLDRHHSAPVNTVVFLSDDGSRLISASDDTTVAQFNCSACTDRDRVIREAVERAETNP
ncbi:MAG: WD40 repeat domain-containing protein [Pseudonocardiaceae bacterium]